MPSTDSSLLDLLARVAPGTPLRKAIERVLQQGSGALLVLGNDTSVEAISSGGFRLEGVSFSAPRLAELAKMDGGIVLDDDWDHILAANVHFLPDSDIPTEETGSRHRTAERLALQTGKSVIAISEGRHLATLFHDGHKIELGLPNVLAARVNQDLQTLERVRRRLDAADERLANLEVIGLATYRSVVTVIQQAELVRRIGRLIEHQTVTLGGEARLIRVQLTELMRGVDQMLGATLSDYSRRRRSAPDAESHEALASLDDQDLDDAVMVGKVMGFPDLDDPAQPLGVRALARVGRIPESVREEILDHFPTFEKMLSATPDELDRVEGIGSTRAALLRRHFDRLRAAASAWEPDPD